MTPTIRIANGVAKKRLKGSLAISLSQGLAELLPAIMARTLPTDVLSLVNGVFSDQVRELSHKCAKPGILLKQRLNVGGGFVAPK